MKKKKREKKKRSKEKSACHHFSILFSLFFLRDTTSRALFSSFLFTREGETGLSSPRALNELHQALGPLRGRRERL